MPRVLGVGPPFPRPRGMMHALTDAPAMIYLLAVIVAGYARTPTGAGPIRRGVPRPAPRGSGGPRPFSPSPLATLAPAHGGAGKGER